MDVLFVEDDPEIRNLLADTLAERRADLEVRAVETAEEALEILTHRPVRLVVSDIRLPGMSGLDLLVTARERWPGLRLILTTAFRHLVTPRQARRQGALHLIHKPFDLDELLAVLDDTLAGDSLLGVLDGISITDLMQLLHWTGRSATLEVSAGGEHGSIQLDRGDVVHARSGALEGMAAFRHILGRPAARFFTRLDTRPEKTTIGWADEPPVREAADATPAEAKATTGAASPAKPKVLVVDDSKTTLLFTARVLRKAGYRVETLDHAWVAPLVSRFSPNLVLMDVELGRSISGPMAIVALKQRKFARNTRFVLYSGLAEDELEGLVKDCSADGWILKGSSEEDLVEAVARHLRAGPGDRT